MFHQQEDCAARNGAGGFTLIELLVVISIIGVLSSVALTSLNAARTRAKVAKAQSQVRQLYDALLRYNVDYGAWPASCDNIDTVDEWNAALYANGYTTLVTKDPWDDTYHFDGCPNIECGPGSSSVCSPGPNRTFESQNRPDMQVVGDDICIFFPPEC